MDFDEFLKLLKDASLSKDEFMELSETPKGTFNGWGTTRLGRKTPHWVKSWVQLYIKNKKLENAVEVLKS